jgi:lysozyme
MLRGIDVSSIQRDVPWEKVAAAGCSFAIVKGASGNAPGPDPMFAKNVAGAQAAGLIVGAYHVAFPLPPDTTKANRDPADQAKYHFDLCRGFGSHDGELGPMLDCEWPEPADWNRWGCSAPQIRAWLLAYLDAATTLWGRLPTVYTYPDWATHVGLASEPAFAKYPLWAASYTHPDRWPGAGEAPASIAPWGGSWRFWQSSGGTQSLWSGVPVDCDVFNGTLEELHALTVGSGTAALAQAAILQAADEIPVIPPPEPPDEVA